MAPDLGLSSPEAGPVSVVPNHIALVMGSPVHDLPQDLYIPPDALEVFLEAFEGPLDLLLYLIRRQGMSIVDISMADITRQYVAYIDMMTVLKLELAAEYLLMAAILTEIKSRMLLPRPAEVIEEEEDPRAELIRRLQEYERFKAAAQDIDTLKRLDRDVHEVTVDTSQIKVNKVYPEVSLQDVLMAFKDILARADQMAHHHIQREPLSVRERMTRILTSLQSRASLPFNELFDLSEGRAGVVVSFLAILEMSKERIIDIFQDEPLGPLEVRPVTTAT